MLLEKLVQADARFSSALRIGNSKSFQRYVCIFFAHSGDSWFWLAGLILIWSISKGPWHSTAAFLAVGLSLLAVVVLILKFSIRRPRPESDWGHIYRATDPHSFPSGHAARAAAIAVMALETGPIWFAILTLTWAPLVGIARIRLGVHYISDVLVGSLIGVLIGIIANILNPFIINLLPFVF